MSALLTTAATRQSPVGLKIPIGSGDLELLSMADSRTAAKRGMGERWRPWLVLGGAIEMDGQGVGAFTDE